MPDDDKSRYVQLICNQPIVTYDKLRRIHPLGLSSPGAYSLEIIDLHVVKIQGMKLMGLSYPKSYGGGIEEGVWRREAGG